MPTQANRRKRYREETLADVHRIAMRQLAEGGPPAVSLNAIAKELGMTGPAMYRYVDSRDALLVDLVVAAYDAMAESLHTAANDAPDTPPDARLRALAQAFRAWALHAPERYLLTFGAPTGSGQLAPDRIIPAVQASMHTILGALAPLADSGTVRPSGTLDAQLEGWAVSRGEDGVDVRVAKLGFTVWTRLHGVTSLELTGHLAQSGVDAELLYQAEVDALVAEARRG